MKKILLIMLALFTLAINMLVISTYNEYKINEFLYGREQLSIKYYDNVDITYEEIKNKLINFSKENNVNITRYSFINDKDLYLYSTNIKADDYIFLDKNYRNEYIDYKNRKLENFTKNEENYFNFYPTYLNITVNDFSKIDNLGLGYRFVLSGFNDEIRNGLTDEFKNYGELEFDKGDIPIIYCVNKSILIITILITLIMSIMLIAYEIQNIKKYSLYTLWGFSNKDISIISHKEITYKVTILSIITEITIISSMCVFVGITYIVDFLIWILFSLGVSLLVINLIYYLIRLITNLIMDIKSSVRGNEQYKSFRLLAKGIKILCSISFILLIAAFINTGRELDIKSRDFVYWEKTENVYYFGITELYQELDKDRDYNDRALEFYKLLIKNHNGFIMNSANFSHSYNGKNSEGITYFYEYNATGEEAIYSYYGRSVTIDRNYLDINPIELEDDSRNIDELLVHDDKYLNILVPIKYKEYEDKIISSYKQGFYFKKVEVDNLYNEELGLPINETRLDDLNINIIYTKNNQSYFTFNNRTGEYKNNAIDPIAVIYDYEIDTSFIGSMLTSSIFFIDDSYGHAYDNIYDIKKESNMKEVGMAYSVFNDANSELVSLRNKVFNQFLGLICLCIFIVVQMIAIVWIDHISSMKRISLSVLMGNSIWGSSSSMMLFSLLVYTMSGALGIVILNDAAGYILLFALSGFILDILVIYGVLRVLTENKLKLMFSGGIS